MVAVAAAAPRMDKKRRVSDVASATTESDSGVPSGLPPVGTTSGNNDDSDWAHESAAATVQPPRVIRTILAAIMLFTVGSIMLYFGVKALPYERDRALAMLVTGAIAFIPGSYACVVIAGTLLGWRGYDYRDLPSYDNE